MVDPTQSYDDDAPKLKFPLLAQRLGDRRRRKSLTRSGLARKATVCFATVKALEEGKRGDPRASTILKLAAALDLPMLNLLGQEDFTEGEVET